MAPTRNSDGTERSLARLLSSMAHTLESDKNVNGRIQYVLEQLRQLVAYEHCALLVVRGEDTLTVLPGTEAHELDQMRPVLEHLWGLLHHGEISLQEASGWQGLEGQELWRSRLAVPLVGLNEVIGVLAVGRDVSGAYDEMDLQLLSIVAGQIASYLTALQAREEEQAQERMALDNAQNEKRRLETFLAILSHELRNPLASIASASRLLTLAQDEAQLQQETLSMLDRQVGIITQLLDDLLDVARVTTREIQLYQTDVELNALVHQVVGAIGPLITGRQQELSLSLADSAPWVHGDPTRLNQVVVNLLSNATKFTPEGGKVWLTVEEDGMEAVIQVRDSGMGIPADYLPHIFDLFSHKEDAIDGAQSGMGIGLSLVKSLVEAHGGTVTATSEGPGKGSEFIVRLPTVQSPPPRAISPPKDSPGEAGRSLRVLLLEDVADTRRLFSRLLEMLGHQVRAVANGPSALETALAFRPDVALLDISLPGMDGYEVARRLRQQPELRNVVLVAVTGYGQESDRRRSSEAGFEHHLVKPIDLDALQRLFAAISETRAQ